MTLMTKRALATYCPALLSTTLIVIAACGRAEDQPRLDKSIFQENISSSDDEDDTFLLQADGGSGGGDLPTPEPSPSVPMGTKCNARYQEKSYYYYNFWAYQWSPSFGPVSSRNDCKGNAPIEEYPDPFFPKATRSHCTGKWTVQTHPNSPDVIVEDSQIDSFLDMNVFSNTALCAQGETWLGGPYAWMVQTTWERDLNCEVVPLTDCPTPEPTATPTPEPSPEPTTEPTPEVTPEPTETPEPTPTPTPAPDHGEAIAAKAREYVDDKNVGYKLGSKDELIKAKNDENIRQDCSQFVKEVMNQAGVDVPYLETAAFNQAMGHDGYLIPGTENPTALQHYEQIPPDQVKPGDVVINDTKGRGQGGHMGVVDRVEDGKVYQTQSGTRNGDAKLAHSHRDFKPSVRTAPVDSFKTEEGADRGKPAKTRYYRPKN